MYAPPDPTAEAVPASLPIESVWRHQTRLTSVDFIHDATEPVWNQDQWLVHVPTNRIESLDNNLFQIQGSFSYLLKLSAPASWSVTGIPVGGRDRWKADAFNLRGFPLDGSAPRCFVSSSSSRQRTSTRLRGWSNRSARLEPTASGDGSRPPTSCKKGPRMGSTLVNLTGTWIDRPGPVSPQLFPPNASSNRRVCSFLWALPDPVAGLAEAGRLT